MNYILPARGVLSMHCSANYGPANDVALFFGLSGTGKTTLSADTSRTLIGDDEHGWSDNGIFNVEGGCYAKMIALSPAAEPEIFATSRMFGTVLENVVYDENKRELDLDDDSITENTRGAYPVSYIPNSDPHGVAGHPENILLLTADAFGVMPPIAKLSHEQAMYYFVSGYTSKLAGTEVGIIEPETTFSPCFGAPFLPRPPAEYADLLGERLCKHHPDVWLINTGWTGGPYGTGSRMPIKDTRAMVKAALDGRLSQVEFEEDSVFGLQIPKTCPDIDQSLLRPRSTWGRHRRLRPHRRRAGPVLRRQFQAVRVRRGCGAGSSRAKAFLAVRRPFRGNLSLGRDPEDPVPSVLLVPIGTGPQLATVAADGARPGRPPSAYGGEISVPGGLGTRVSRPGFSTSSIGIISPRILVNACLASSPCGSGGSSSSTTSAR